MFAAILLSCAKRLSKQNTVLVDVEEKQMLLDLEDVQLVDVRTSLEYQNGHINKALNIDYNSPTFSEEIAHLDKDKPVVLYCQKGGRSAKSAKKMSKAGFKNIYDLKGGFLMWKSEKLDLKLLE